MLGENWYIVKRPTIMQVITCLYLSYVLLPMMAISLPQMVRYCISILIFSITIIYLLGDSFSYSMVLIVSVLIFTLCLYKGSNETNLMSYIANSFLFWEALFLGRYYLVTSGIDVERIIKFYFIIQFVTLTTTIVGCSVYPLAPRELARGLVDSATIHYQKINIGGYKFIYGIVLVLPFVMLKLKTNDLLKKIFYTIFLGASIYCLLVAQYTTALLVMCLVIFLCIAYDSNHRVKSMILIITVFLIAYFFRYAIADLFNYLAEKSAASNLDSISERFKLLNEFITNQKIDGDAADRQDRYLTSIEAFKSNPVFGNFFEQNMKLGGHSAILDIIGSTGIIGLLQFIAILCWNVCGIIIYFEKPIFKYIIISFLGFLIVASLNTIFTSVDIGVSIFLIPVLLAKEENR